MERQIATEARALLKETTDYPIFFYDAQKVGITATGTDDENELYPNPRIPTDCEGETALSLYHKFREAPEAFALETLLAADENPDMNMNPVEQNGNNAHEILYDASDLPEGDTE